MYVLLEEEKCLLKLSKKKKDVYCYLSKRTISTLLFLSKRDKPYQLNMLMSKEEFVEFYYDLITTDLMYVFWIWNPSEPLFKDFNLYLDCINFYEINETNKLDMALKDFYKIYGDQKIGLYSTLESMAIHQIWDKYTIKIEKEEKEEENLEGFHNYIKSDTVFVKNQVADDILKEYIDDFEDHNLQFSKNKYTELNNTFLKLEPSSVNKAEWFRKSYELTRIERNNRIPKHYLQYKLLISKMNCIFGKYYETYGKIMRINDVTIFDNPKEFIEFEYKIEQIRIYELLLSLWKNKYIDIADIHIDVKNKKYLLNIEFNYPPEDIKRIHKRKNDIERYSIDKAFKYYIETKELFYDNIRIIPNEKNDTLDKAYLETLLYLLRNINDIKYDFFDIDVVYENIKKDYFDCNKNSNWAQNCISRTNKFLTKTKYKLTQKDKKIGLKIK